MFADDLSAFKEFDTFVPNQTVLEIMSLTRSDVHRWGHRNRVNFDPSKEHIVVLHPRFGQGDVFKFLGCLIDVKLNMAPAIDQICGRVRPKVKALLRTRGLYKPADMIMQYKTHIWGLIEYHSGAIMHACDSSLQKLDRIQVRFLEELHFTEQCAFLEHNFAPSELRRDIGILGFLHKRVLGLCHSGVKQLLPMSAHAGPWHSKQLDCRIAGVITQHNLYFRSLFGMAMVYNRLPEHIVNLPTVSAFQKALTQVAKARCANEDAGWRKSFHDSSEIWRSRTYMD